MITLQNAVGDIYLTFVINKPPLIYYPIFQEYIGRMAKFGPSPHAISIFWPAKNPSTDSDQSLKEIQSQLLGLSEKEILEVIRCIVEL